MIEFELTVSANDTNACKDCEASVPDGTVVVWAIRERHGSMTIGDLLCEPCACKRGTPTDSKNPKVAAAVAEARAR